MVSRRTKRLCTVAALAAAMLLASAGMAFAAPAPTPETLGLEALQAKLTAVFPDPIVGYMKTVVKGSDIVEIPVNVLAVSGDDPSTDLIMFEATGTLMAKYGGVVEGMSGSPIYIDDEGVDKIIGAVSYGDMFTLGGTGLATPIESMLQITADYAPRVKKLSAPVLLDGRVVSKIVVPSNPSSYKADPAGTFVAKSLSSVFIGGVRPNSRLFANLKRRLTEKNPNLSVVTLAAPLSAGHSSFSTDLDPGSSVTGLMSRGDLWIGGLGTVTYSDPDSVLAFGHSLDWDGSTSLYMTNAWVDGVWPSLYAPYKMGYPTAVRGEFTQDRTPGCLGVLDQMPAEVPVTAHVVDADTGRDASSTAYFTSKLFDTGVTSGYAGYAASIAGYKLYDQWSTPGSALTTTTVVVSDGAHEYTVSIPNFVDDSVDIPSWIAYDVDSSVSSLLSVLNDGLQQPHIVSIDLHASVTHTRHSGRIVSVKPKTALKVGANPVDVSVLQYGVAETQTVAATITIPAGTPVSGLLTASSLYYDSSEISDFMGDTGEVFPTAPDVTAPERPTIAQVVDELNATPPDNTMVISFYPESNADTGDAGSAASVDTTVSIDTTVTTPWIPSDSAEILATELTAKADTVLYGDEGDVYGEIFGPEKAVTVSVFGTPAGSTAETLIATDTAKVDPDTGDLAYDVYLPAMYRNTTLRVHVDGGTDYTAADTFVMQKVKAYVRMTASTKSVKHGKSVTLTAYVYPGASAGTLTFQYYSSSSGTWRTIKARALTPGSSYARATYSWKPTKGTRKVRALYAGGVLNAGAASSSMTIKAK